MMSNCKWCDIIISEDADVPANFIKKASGRVAYLAL
jgi:hypothetical protein